MSTILRTSVLSSRKIIWVRRVILASSIAMAVEYVGPAAGDAEDMHLAQQETKPAATAGTPTKESRGAEPREKEQRPQDKKIRMRGLDPEQSPSPVPTPVEKSPSIDPDAQKGLLDRMKGCCGEPKN